MQLYKWQNNSKSLLSVSGVVYYGISEADNRLEIGISKSATKSAIKARINKLDIPKEAVNLVITEPFEFKVGYRSNRNNKSSASNEVTLREKTAIYKEAGLQIAFGNYICTLGFEASPDMFKWYSVVNSHCTNNQGGVEHTKYYQPVINGGDFIGKEIKDPMYSFNYYACPPGRKCRYSDAALMKNNWGSPLGAYVINNPEYRGRYSGSIVISNPYPWFVVIGEGGGFSVVVGTEVNKVGRTTGWTYGDVTNTCVDINVTNTNITLLCQNTVNAGVGPGDSGSAVFKYAPSYTPEDSEVILLGLLWGGNYSGTVFAYSPINNIEQELGELTTTTNEL